MNISDIKDKRDALKKFFVAPNGEIFTTTGLHEVLAIEICTRNQWDLSNVLSAEDFIISQKDFIKFSNYGKSEFRYVAVKRGFERQIEENACLLADLFNLRMEWY